MATHRRPVRVVTGGFDLWGRQYAELGTASDETASGTAVVPTVFDAFERPRRVHLGIHRQRAGLLEDRVTATES